LIIGYARVSRAEQHLELQIDALEAAGCERIYRDQISGSKDSRPGLDECLRGLREGDTLVVWRLDRLGRSLTHLVETINGFKDTGIQFKSLQEEINTSTAVGTLMFHLFAMFAEFERNLISERTLAGLESARARGRKGGRRPVLDKRKAAAMVELYRARNHSAKDLCQMFGISRTTLFKYLKEEE
jgi:DNA invertase Pin-like site-specific DNA recombinase